MDRFEIQVEDRLKALADSLDVRSEGERGKSEITPRVWLEELGQW